jgi:hypothetical protein
MPVASSTTGIVVGVGVLTGEVAGATVSWEMTGKELVPLQAARQQAAMSRQNNRRIDLRRIYFSFVNRIFLFDCPDRDVRATCFAFITSLRSVQARWVSARVVFRVNPRINQRKILNS